MAQPRTLYSYWRSSASYRVRIALNLKGMDYAIAPVHLVRDGGEQHHDDYRKLNPQQLVPTLVDGRQVLHESLAIIEYLDDAYPCTARLLPRAALACARVRALAQMVACEIHPLGNLRVLQYLQRELGISDAQKAAWSRHWIKLGFDAIEAVLAARDNPGKFCEGDAPTLADCCLVPQVYNARRFGVPLDPYPILVGIDAACARLDAFKRAAPEAQADAPPEDLR
ncbi:MAG TPA: maleylacetoacetate isomerase [Rhodanobacteraceae bacterium]|nr:maleylacetoacetate isomerase [Rhodanobacteraceae bacterium]